ncbi:MAG: hypothetical protein P4M11_14855 [Candidatus Pacebacteria bacterium]|nr:hypothetical protein [Candidatus Paceibacterota bacterium]
MDTMKISASSQQKNGTAETPAEEEKGLGSNATVCNIQPLHFYAVERPFLSQVYSSCG